MTAQSCGIKDYLDSLVAQIRADERERAARIVEEWPVESRYIVGQIRIEHRRKQIAQAIRGNDDQHSLRS